MFRKMRRFNQEISQDQCKLILRTEKRGVFSVLGDYGYPYSVPINFYFDDAKNIIYIHGAKCGHKIDAIQNCNKVCFTTWNQGYLSEGDWAYHPTSVIVFGKAEFIQDRETTVSAVRSMGQKYYPDGKEVEEEIERDIHHVQLIALHIEHMTGKTVHEK